MMWSDEQALALDAVFHALNQSGIPWLVLRNYEGLPQDNRSKDIDLGLEKLSIPSVVDNICSVLKLHGFDRAFVQSYQYVCCCTFFKTVGAGVVSIKIDLLDGFVWRGAQIFDFKDIYSSRVVYRDFWVPNEVDDAVMLWMKPLLTGGIIKERYVADIMKVCMRNPDQFRERLERSFSRSLVDAVWPAISLGKLSETVPYKASLARDAWVQAFLRAPSRTLTACIDHFFSEIIRRSKRIPGSFIAVVGPDGVGKTTFIHLLQKQLACVLVKDIEDIQVNHFRPHLLPNIKQIFSGRANVTPVEEFSNPHRAKPASGISSLFRLMYYWLDYLLGYWLVNRRKCARGGVLVFDRYFYDFVADPRRSRISLPKWVRKIFLRMTPQPDIVFFLDCNADVVFARKQELSRNEIERQLNEYRQMVSEFPEKFVRLNAQQAPEISCGNAVKELVIRSFRRI